MYYVDRILGLFFFFESGWKNAVLDTSLKYEPWFLRRRTRIMLLFFFCWNLICQLSQCKYRSSEAFLPRWHDGRLIYSHWWWQVNTTFIIRMLEFHLFLQGINLPPFIIGTLLICTCILNSSIVNVYPPEHRPFMGCVKLTIAVRCRGLRDDTTCQSHGSRL